MSVTPESPETAPERPVNAVTPQRQHKGISPLRKALAAAVVGVFLLTGAGIASNGFTENPVAAVASQSHDAQASSGALSGHYARAKGGMGTDVVKAVSVVPAVKKEPVAVAKSAPVECPGYTPPPAGERYGTVSIPRLGPNWKHFLVEGTGDPQLDSPGSDDPSALGNYETALGHSTCTQRVGSVGNVGMEGHRTPGTFKDLGTLQIGDPIVITEAKTGTVYTYAVIQTMSPELPFKTLEQQYYATSALNPIPFDDYSLFDATHPAKHPAKKRLLTMTSCGADLATTSDFRVYVQAELRSVTAGK